MPKYIVDGSDLTSVANTIRTKGGTSGSLSFPNGWSSAINAISGGGLEYEEGTWTPSEDIADTTISFSNSHTTPPIMVMITETSSQSIGVADSNALLAICNPYTYLGYPIVNGTASRYGLGEYYYTSSTGLTATVTTMSSEFTMGTYLSTTYFRAYTGGTSRYWRAGRTYKWIAVWAPTT